MPIGHGAPIVNFIALQLPHIVTRLLAVLVLQKRDAMRRPVTVFLLFRLQKSVAVVKHQAGRADKVTKLMIINAAIIQKMLKESAGRIEDARRIKRQYRIDMFAQKSGRFKVRCVYVGPDIVSHLGDPYRSMDMHLV